MQSIAPGAGTGYSLVPNHDYESLLGEKIAFLDAPDRYLRQIMIDSEAGDG